MCDGAALGSPVGLDQLHPGCPHPHFPPAPSFLPSASQLAEQYFLLPSTLHVQPGCAQRCEPPLMLWLGVIASSSEKERKRARRTSRAASPNAPSTRGTTSPARQGEPLFGT